MKQWTLETVLSQLDAVVVDLTGSNLEDNENTTVGDLIRELVNSEFDSKFNKVRSSIQAKREQIPGQTMITVDDEAGEEG